MYLVIPNKIYAANVNTPQKNIYAKLFRAMRLKILINSTMIQD